MHFWEGFLKDSDQRRGRKKAYQREDGRAGAPQITLRLSPEVLTRVRTHPDGSRAYVERLVTEDMEKSGDVERAPEAIKASDALD